MAEDNRSFKLFGFEIKRASKESEKLQSIVPQRDDDGAGYASAGAGHFGKYVNID